MSVHELRKTGCIGERERERESKIKRERERILSEPINHVGINFRIGVSP